MIYKPKLMSISLNTIISNHSDENVTGATEFLDNGNRSDKDNGKIFYFIPLLTMRLPK